MISSVLLVPALALAACSVGQLQPADPDPVVSPGTVTYRFLLPSTRSFCDQVPACGGGVPKHVSLTTVSGQVVGFTTGLCEPDCSKCDHACPLILPLPACNVPPAGIAVTGPFEGIWDGGYTAHSTCGNDVPCYHGAFARPGRYISWFCATPGTFAQPDTGPPTCTPTGPQECVQVPFDFPGPPIQASLPDLIDVDPPPPPDLPVTD
jgi:hypothetical protein